MQTYARIINGIAVDVVVTDNINDRFHPSLIPEFVVVPDGTKDGYILVNGIIVAPSEPETDLPTK